jgi:hypothetical protein
MIGKRTGGLQTSIAVLVSLLDDRGIIERTGVAEGLREVARGQSDREVRMSAECVVFIN